MLVSIWDFLFTRRVWNTIEIVRIEGKGRDGNVGHIGSVYTLRDQFGNIKRKKIDH